MSNDDMIIQRTHIEEMDFAEMKHRQAAEMEQIKQDAETKRAKLRASEARQSTYQTIGIAFFVAAVFISIVLAVWSPWEPPGPPEPDTETQREIICIENGGGWVPDDLVTEGDSGLCVYPGKQAVAPSE